MVRFLKVSHLEEQRRALVARSEIYRRTIHVETANVRFSLRQYKQRLRPLRAVRHLLKLSAPLAGIFLARKRTTANGTGGFVASLLSGMKLAAEFMPLFRKAPTAPAEERPETHN